MLHFPERLNLSYIWVYFIFRQLSLSCPCILLSCTHSDPPLLHHKSTYCYLNVCLLSYLFLKIILFWTTNGNVQGDLHLGIIPGVA